jgi:hypothetical protein
MIFVHHRYETSHMAFALVGGSKYLRARKILVGREAARRVHCSITGRQSGFGAMVACAGCTRRSTFSLQIISIIITYNTNTLQSHTFGPGAPCLPSRPGCKKLFSATATISKIDNLPLQRRLEGPLHRLTSPRPFLRDPWRRLGLLDLARRPGRLDPVCS